VKVTVKRLTTSLKVTTDHATYGYDATVHVTAHLGTTYTNRSVSIYARSLGSVTKKLIASGKVNSKGNLTAKYVAPHSTEFYAVFTGDAHFAPATATRTVGVRVQVTMPIGGNYGSTTINGRTYKLYHHNANLTFTIAVAPNKHGQCVKLQLAEFVGGRWVSATSGCGTLNKFSKISSFLSLSGAPLNVPFRIRADFVRSSTDVSNLNNHSSWDYFKVEN
jgi:hypothetical protein